MISNASRYRNSDSHLETFFLTGIICLILILIPLAPTVSISSNRCSACHGSGYYQQIDFLEGSSQNSIPSAIDADQTLSVTVALENINNSPVYSQLSSVTVTLSSLNNHFAISNPTYNIGSMPTGTTTATWQITGKSAGTDQMIITASAFNTHGSVSLTDSYSPNPTITVSGDSSIIEPTPTPTMSSTSIPTNNPSIQPTPNPTQKPTATPKPTAPSQPTSTPQSTNNTTTPTPSPEPSNNETQPNHASELNSNMLYIHPTLSIVSYVFIFLFTIINFKGFKNKREKLSKAVGLSALLFTLLGLITGMIWAQIAWGSYWTWDIKETMTLFLFIVFTISAISFFERKSRVTNWLLIFSCLIVVINILNSFVVSGLHSFV